MHGDHRGEPEQVGVAGVQDEGALDQPHALLDVGERGDRAGRARRACSRAASFMNEYSASSVW